MPTRASARLRHLITESRLFVAPSCFGPLGARLAQEAGPECAAVGGYAVGAHLAIPEPLLTMTEMLESARRIAAAVNIPVIADAGAGYGEPLHVVRTAQEFERAGVAGIHIEDQVFPKRAHYHRDYREHTISADEMVAKIRFAVRARRDPDFLIIARNDAMRTGGYEEGVRRARLYVDAGAEMAMLFPNTREEATRAPRECGVPLIHVNSAGNRVGRPVIDTVELSAMGYRGVVDAITFIIAACESLRSALAELKATGVAGPDPARAIAARTALETTLGLEDAYEVEAQTVEPA